MEEANLATILPHFYIIASIFGVICLIQAAFKFKRYTDDSIHNTISGAVISFFMGFILITFGSFNPATNKNSDDNSLTISEKVNNINPDMIGVIFSLVISIIIVGFLIYLSSLGIKKLKHKQNIKLLAKKEQDELLKSEKIKKEIISNF